MIALKNLAATCAIACGLAFQAGNAAAEVSPIVGDYGNIAPTLTEQNLNNVFRTSDPAPWFVTFNLTKEANVALGVQALPPSNNGSVFDPSFIRIVTFDQGSSVADGTDTFTNPFPDPVDHLVRADHLTPGKYALEVNGFGNRTVTVGGMNPGIRDAADFTTRLQVMPIPEPETYALMLAGLGLVGVMARRRTRSFA